MSEAMPDKSGITRQDIRALIELFYTRVRADERLGPIFHAKIGVDDAEWAPHQEKIENFWANVMLHELAYQGNPLLKHAAVREIQPAHFERWLDIFEQTAQEVLPERKAATFNTLARRIGRSLSMGIEVMRSDQPHGTQAESPTETVE
jgi:hemoglobin